MEGQIQVSGHSTHKALDVFHGHRSWWKEPQVSRVIWLKDANIGQRELEHLKYNLSTNCFHTVELLNCKGAIGTYLRTCIEHGIPNVSIHDRSRSSDFSLQAIAAIGKSLLEGGDKVNLRKLSLRINIFNEDIEQNPQVKEAWVTFLQGIFHAKRTLREVSFCPHDPWEAKLSANHVQDFTHALAMHSQLKSLDISQCDISPASYHHIMSLLNLESLTVHESLQHPRSLMEFLRHLPQMKRLQTLQLPNADKRRPRAVRNRLLTSLRDTSTRMGNCTLRKVYLGEETYEMDAEVQFYLTLNVTPCRAPLDSLSVKEWTDMVSNLGSQYDDQSDLCSSMMYYLVRRSAPLIKSP